MKPATIDMGIEVVTIPVADVGRAKAFYESLGWRLDTDLIERGVEVSDLFHLGASGFEPGPDPERASYRTFASFVDPDGNSWLLQEVTERRDRSAGADNN